MCLEIHILTCIHHWCYHLALSGTSRHFFFSVGEQKWSDPRKLAKEKITSSASLPTISSLLSSPPVSLRHTFTHHHIYFFPFCCQATDRKNITWRRKNHRKSSQEDDASHRCSREELGSMRTHSKTLFYSFLSTWSCYEIPERCHREGQSSWSKWMKNIT